VSDLFKSDLSTQKHLSNFSNAKKKIAVGHKSAGNWHGVRARQRGTRREKGRLNLHMPLRVGALRAAVQDSRADL